MGGKKAWKFARIVESNLAASTTSDKFLFVKGQGSELIGVKVNLESIKCIDWQYSTKFTKCFVTNIF